MAKIPIRVEFEANHFDEGRFRKAYKGKYLSPPSMYGKLAVVKRNKDSYVWNPTDLKITVNMCKEAQVLAQEFNKQFKVPLSFTDVNVVTVFQSTECVTVEDYIPGRFEKWCTNFGFISYQAQTVDVCMPAFMHWSWWYTRGEKMISDLQGVRSTDPYHPRYILTDPAMLSLTNSYGPTDMGVEGMAMFFMHHNCNMFCQALPKPIPEDFTGIIPREKLSAAMLQLNGIGNATSYSQEVTDFPPEVKQSIIAVFKRVACNRVN